MIEGTPYGGYPSPYGDADGYGAVVILATLAAAAAKVGGAIGTAAFTGKFVTRAAAGRAADWVAANPDAAGAVAQAGGGLFGLIKNRREAKQAEADYLAQTAQEARRAGFNTASQQYQIKLAAIQAMRTERARQNMMRSLLVLGMVAVVAVALISAAKPQRRNTAGRV